MKEEKFLYKELSYKIIGLCLDIHNEYGSMHKENIYHNVLAEKLNLSNINFKSKPKINIFSKLTGKKIGCYEPDFVINKKIILELKVIPNVLKQFEIQVSEYIKTSEYELGYLINFGLKSLYFRRIIFTNNNKGFIAAIK